MNHLTARTGLVQTGAHREIKIEFLCEIEFPVILYIPAKYNVSKTNFEGVAKHPCLL